LPYDCRPGPGARLMFTVRNIEGTIEELKKRGVEVAAPIPAPGGQRVALFRDPDGNNLGLHQSAPKSAQKPRM
jgi:predicted enzyme related to lactoylglutathione lyase